MKRLFVVVAAGVVLGACGGGKAGEEVTASMEFGLTANPNFTGNSVYICADRVQDADGKYPCSNHVCDCFNFNVDGLPLANNGDPARFTNLCPSADFPTAQWDFKYTVWSGLGCTGTQITSPTNPFDYNFTCYDVADLKNRYHPNAWRESLLRGENRNDILCLTTNASKTWEFDVCVDISSAEDLAWNKLRLDCGCVVDPTAPQGCRCSQQFPFQTMPPGCRHSDNFCYVVCDDVPPIQSACGNGTTEAAEGCDDGDITAGDGCSATCTVEPGWQCFGSPSLCTLVGTCGNAVIEAAEACDDGNLTNFDGCSSQCQLETPGKLVINEVDYDQPGLDEVEFVEILNVGGTNVSLQNLSVIFVNGANGLTYTTVSLVDSGLPVLPPNSYLVLASAAVSVAAGAAVITFPGAADSIQNGDPDGIAIVDDAFNVLDALSYGGVTIATLPVVGSVSLVEGAPTPALDSGAVGGSLVRLPNGTDSDNAATDWAFSATPTPGAPNL